MLKWDPLQIPCGRPKFFICFGNRHPRIRGTDQPGYWSWCLHILGFNSLGRFEYSKLVLIKTKQYSDFFFVLIFRLSPGTRQAMWWSNYEGKLLACFHWDPASSFSRFGNELNWGGWSILVTQLVWVIQSICFLNVICWCLSLKHATLTWKERHRIQYSSLSTVIKYST